MTPVSWHLSHVSHISIKLINNSQFQYSHLVMDIFKLILNFVTHFMPHIFILALRLTHDGYFILSPSFTFYFELCFMTAVSGGNTSLYFELRFMTAVSWWTYVSIPWALFHDSCPFLGELLFPFHRQFSFILFLLSQSATTSGTRQLVRVLEINKIMCIFVHSPVEVQKSMFCGMDDVLGLILVLWLVLSRNQPGASWGKNLSPKTKWPPGDYVANHKYPVTSLVLVLEC